MGGAGNEARNDEPAGPAAAWAFALFSAAALLAVAAQVFLGVRPLQGMLPPLDQVTEFYVSPSHKDMVRFTVEENGLVQALGELRVAWAGALSGHPL